MLFSLKISDLKRPSKTHIVRVLDLTVGPVTIHILTRVYVKEKL